MESSKHSLQDHHLLLLSSSSSSSSPTSSCTTLLHDSSSCYAATTPIPGGSPHLCWTPNIFLNSAAGNGLNSSYVNNQSLQNHQVHLVSSSLDSTMTPHHHQDLSFHHWANDTNNINTNIINPHQDLQQFSHSHNIKREFPYSKKFSELISSSPSSSSTIEDHHNNQCSNSSHHRATAQFFSQIYPTINIPPSSSSSSSSTSSTTTFHDMNLQALDLFHYSARSLMQDQLDLSSSRRNGGGSLSYNALHHNDHHYMQRPFSSNNMTVLPFSSTGGVVAETKRSDDEVLLLETKATHEAEVVPAPANKRSRLESRASCTPFKVRKEKLGDRIAALQQLVAPFGKTDTASVLMEAIGYIKFLQNQVETLSVPYLKSSRNKTHQRHVQGGTILNEERKRDLRSRGLCLVPLSCLSYMTDSGGAVWPPPNFGGGT